MIEKINVKNGILKKFNVDKTIEILQIGYTLDEYETGYKNAIIVREGENNNIITDNPEVIMRFLNLYALQNETTIDEIFKDSFVRLLQGLDEDKLDDLINKKYFLNKLRNKKMDKIEYMICSIIISLLSYGGLRISDIRDEQVLLGFIASFVAGKFFYDAQNISISRVKKELEELIQEFGEDLMDKTNSMIRK